MLLSVFWTSLLVSLGLLSASGQSRIVTVYETTTTCVPLVQTLGTKSISSEAKSASSPTSTVWTDANIAAGEPFLLEVQGIDGSVLGKRQQVTPETSWLMENGNTTTNSNRAAVCSIDRDGHLHVNNKIMSVNESVQSASFVANMGTFSISTKFSTANTMLSWTNSTFSNGTAQFYKLPIGLLDNAQILGKYYGPPEPNRGWTPITLWARSLNMDSGSPASISSVSPSSSASIAGSSASSVSIPVPSNVSSNGGCGPSNGGFTCQGSPFGVCCGADGRCSSSDNACQAGCQPNFGFCAPAGAKISDNGLCGQQHHKVCLGSQFGTCCSIYGYCGNTTEFCAPDNCAVGFGYCSPDTTSSTTLGARPSSETALTFVTMPRSLGSSTSASIIVSSTATEGRISFSLDSGNSVSLTMISSASTGTQTPVTFGSSTSTSSISGSLSSSQLAITSSFTFTSDFAPLSNTVSLSTSNGGESSGLSSSSNFAIGISEVSTSTSSRLSIASLLFPSDLGTSSSREGHSVSPSTSTTPSSSSSPTIPANSTPATNSPHETIQISTAVVIPIPASYSTPATSSDANSSGTSRTSSQGTSSGGFSTGSVSTSISSLPSESIYYSFIAPSPSPSSSASSYLIYYDDFTTFSSSRFTTAPISSSILSPSPSLLTTTINSPSLSSFYTPMTSSSSSYPSAPAPTTIISSLSSAFTASSPSSSPSYPPGACGSEYGNQTCTAANSGPCCSKYGFCGGGIEFCGSGCQASFGYCDPVDISSSPISASIPSFATFVLVPGRVPHL